MKTISVKNAYGDSNTEARIIQCNTIKYTPKISVIIPVYNTEKYLRECLNSIVNQTLKDIEIICVDDGSTDDSLKILQEYAQKDNRFTIITQKNYHAGIARNTGLTVARGEYIHFIDSDDFIDLCFYNNMYNYITSYEADLVCCSWNIIRESQREYNDDYSVIKYNGYKIFDLYCKSSVNVEIWNKLFKRKLINEYNIKFPSYHYGEDTSFTMQYLFIAKSIYGVKEKIFNYRLSPYGLMAQIYQDDSKIIHSIKSLIYTYTFLKRYNNLNNDYNKYFYVNRLFYSVKYLLSLCLPNNYIKILKNIRNDILKNISYRYLLHKSLRYIKKEKYKKAIYLLTDKKVNISSHYKYYMDYNTNNLSNFKQINVKKLQDINVTFLLDNKYFRCSYIAIVSLINSKNVNSSLFINILSSDLTGFQKKLLKNLQRSLVVINIIDVDVSKYSEFKKVYHVTTTALVKFDFAEILKDTDKTIYIDGDVLITKDLTDLFNVDINKYYIGAVREIRAEKRKYNELVGSKYYINSGVILFNLKKIREDNIPQKFFETKKYQPKEWRCMDQDVINHVCREKILALPPQYNNMVGIIIKEKYNIQDINSFYNTDYKNINDFIKKSSIIHFAGDLKPWNDCKLPYDLCKKYRYFENHIILSDDTKKYEKKDYSFIKKIFSITKSGDKKHKIITVLGLKFKIKRKKFIHKEQIKNLECQMADIKVLQKNTEEQLNNVLNKLDNIKNDSEKNFLKLINSSSELNYTNLFHDSTLNSEWLKNKNFSLYGGAANYSFIYTLFKILDNAKPKNILEFGLGQTTKLTSQYAIYSNCKLDVCEHNLEWINIYKKQLPNEKNININHLDLEYFDYDGVRNDRYANLNIITKDRKFDLIIVDGPIGYKKNFPRSNILEVIENNSLDENFIIIIDDTERKGEQMLIKKIKDMLTEKNIDFVYSIREGNKQQSLITSTSFSYIKNL